MLGITDYLWRLLPANPILLRVVATSSKRLRDLLIRCIYLGLLVLIVLFSISNSGSTGGGNLAALSITSTRIFEQLSYLQLALVALLAPIFTAGAITQEKDSQTYDILLATPLTNGQIVLGSLCSRLFFVFTLLLSGVPIFSITQVFGGVAIGDIVMSVLIAAATASITGALAIAIATFKVGTRRTIFSFYVFNVVYLVGLYLLDTLPSFGLTLADGSKSAVGWLTPIHPFLALRAVLDPNQFGAPSLAQLPAGLRWWPASFAFTNPAGFYVAAMTVVSLLLVLPSILLLRRMAQSTTSIKSRLLKLVPIKGLDTTHSRKPRTVWSNPIAWREAKTKASAARATVLRAGFVLAGLAAAVALLVGFLRETSPPTRYIDGGYDPTNGTLLVRGDNITYLVDDATRVTLDGQPAPTLILDGRYGVAAKNERAGRGGVKVLNTIDLRSIPRYFDAKDVRKFLFGLVLVEVTMILLTITNAAASTVTREKEDGTLDILLATPITSRYYIWGKVRGLVSFVLPLIAVPVASCAIFVVADAVRYLAEPVGFQWIVLPEALVVLPPMLVVVAAFASIVGMQMSLRLRTTTMAVISSVGLVFAACGFLGLCGYQLLQNGTDEPYVAIGSFSPFTVMMLLIAPRETIGGLGQSGGLSDGARMIGFVFGLAASGAYAAIVYFMYTSMVKNFDMTIRKQSR